MSHRPFVDINAVMRTMLLKAYFHVSPISHQAGRFIKKQNNSVLKTALA